LSIRRPPAEPYDAQLEGRQRRAGIGVVNVCMPCLIHRGLQDSPVLDGVVRIKGPDLLDKKDLATKILSFT
jgi:hypothetical protein